MANKRRLLTDEEIALAICESRTRTEAAERLHMGTRQLYERLQSYEVQALIRAIRADQLQKRLAMLESAQESAIQTITAIMQDPESTNFEKLKAAGMILESGRLARAETAAADADAIGKLRNAEAAEADRLHKFIF